MPLRYSTGEILTLRIHPVRVGGGLGGTVVLHPVHSSSLSRVTCDVPPTARIVTNHHISNNAFAAAFPEAPQPPQGRERLPPTSGPLTTSPLDGARAERVAPREAPAAAGNAPLPPKGARALKRVCPESLPLGSCCCCCCWELGISASLNWEVRPNCAEQHAGGRTGPRPPAARSPRRTSHLT